MFNTHEVHEWIFKNAHGIIAIKTPDVETTALKPSKVGNAIYICYPFDFENNHEFSHKWRNHLLPFASIHWDIFFAISQENLHNEKCTLTLNCSSSETQGYIYPQVYLVDSIGIKYKMTSSSSLKDDFSTQLEEFIEKFKSGQINHSLSYERPKSNLILLHEKFPSVGHITGKNLHTAITFETKPVFLSLYNSSHSDNSFILELLKNLTQVAKSLERRNVAVTTMDTETNALPSELQLKCLSPIHMVIVEKPERKQWKEMIRFKDGEKNGPDSLVSFVQNVLNARKVDVNRKATLDENLHHKPSVRVKSEL